MGPPGRLHRPRDGAGEGVTRRQEDFEEEIRSHLELEAERLRRLGLSPKDAALAARKHFGNVGVAQERFHDTQRFKVLRDLARDTRDAARTLIRVPAFSVAVIPTLA